MAHPAFPSPIIMKSPSGKVVVPSVGPLDAEIMLVGESPARHELESMEPFVGIAGKMLNKGLIQAGLDRAGLRITNLVPVRPQHDKFAEHLVEDLHWGIKLLEAEIDRVRPKVIVALGANPLRVLTGFESYAHKHGRRGGISDWRGSLIDPQYWLFTLHPQYRPRSNVPVFATYHPAAVTRQMEWHVDFLRDLRNVSRYVRGDFVLPAKRLLVINSISQFEEFVYAKREVMYEREGVLVPSGRMVSKYDMVGVDTEQSPDSVAIATDEEIYVFDPTSDPRWLGALKDLIESPQVLKIAHNWNHDAAYLWKHFQIRLVPPRFDTMGGAHILDPSLGKALSPDISSRFTTWPYHKWLDEIDSAAYNAYDAAVAYDAYWPIMDQLEARGLRPISQHDHRLLDVCIEMQERGFRVDLRKQREQLKSMGAELDSAVAKLEHDVQEVVHARIHRFQKPHLFVHRVKCTCCGGGTAQRSHCQRCSGFVGAFDAAIGGDPDWKLIARVNGFKSIKAFKASWSRCQTCQATGKVAKWLPFNPDSPDQVADLIYRGLGVPSRRFKGKETVRVMQLEMIQDRHALIAEIVRTQKLRADKETVERLAVDTDGRVHPVTDPWGTVSGRVAGKEGLVYVGTNPQNIPKKARVLVVPDPGYFLMYPDMEQIEARNVAVLSNDPGLKAALTEVIPEKGKPDIHLFVKRELDKIDTHLLDGPHVAEFGYRQACKKLEYAAFYGIRASNLGKELGISESNAQKALDAFGYVFPGVPRWHRDTLAEALDTRTLVSPTGRIRTWLGYIYDPKLKGIKYEVAKEMWSFKPQDMAAYILALGLFELRADPDVEILIHVHDAPLLQSLSTKHDEVVPRVLAALTRNVWGMDYPAEMKEGTNWYEASGG